MSVPGVARANAFALTNSGLNPFLFAEVGTELNGSPLTILSVLARLGQDPWVLAAQWVKLPKALIIDRLTQSITQMPLTPRALAEASVTAARLVLLLPAQTETIHPAMAGPSVNWQMPRWAPLAIFCFAMAFVVVAGLVSAPKPNASVSAPAALSVPHGQ
jgi:hypothetical protein